jgi:hypothetical protein
MAEANKKYFFTENFFNNISNNILLVRNEQSDKYKVFYANRI